MNDLWVKMAEFLGRLNGESVSRESYVRTPEYEKAVMIRSLNMRPACRQKGCRMISSYRKLKKRTWKSVFRRWMIRPLIPL